MYRKFVTWFFVICLILTIFVPQAQAKFIEDVIEKIHLKSIDTSISYSHFSSNQLVVHGLGFYNFLIIGTLDVKELKRDIVIPSLTANFQIEPGHLFQVTIPYKYRHDYILYPTSSVLDALPAEMTFDEHGLGDIQLSYTIEGDEEPESTSFGLKTPTGPSPYDSDIDLPIGNGHWGFKLGVTRVLRVDPVMLFGSVGYLWNIPRDVGGDYGEVDPGDTFNYSLGLIYALNERLTMNTRLEHSVTSETKQDNEVQVGTNKNSALLYLGSTYKIDDKNGVDFIVGAGLTEDSPDFTIKLSRQYSF